MDEVKDYSTELAAAREFALLGGKIAIAHYRRNPETKLKQDGTWVTEADWKVEAQIRLRIARTFPEHNVLGEEEGLTAAGGGQPRDGAPTWVVDPIDGTNNYMAGIPIWGVLVGLREETESVVGVCHLPALNETYDGGVGLGARMNGEPIAVDPLPKLNDATVLFAGAESFERYGLKELLDGVATAAWRTRGFGDCWGHMLVARGAAHAMIEPELSLWDVAALQPIVEEAGGRLTRLDGEGWIDGGSCLTSNGAVHDELLALVPERWKDTTAEQTLRRPGD